MKLSIVIPVWNNANFTKACLEDLVKLPDDHEIIVVNNGSTDNTESIIPSRVKHIKHEENMGFAYACNTGYQNATGEYVMFLNNDIRVRGNFTNWTLPLIEAASDGAIVGPTIGVLNSELAFVEERESWPKTARKQYCYMSGWNITALKTTWEKLVVKRGPFDEVFGKAYFEDTDLGLRSVGLGIPSKLVEVPVTHFGKMTSRNMNVGFLYGNARTIFLEMWKDKAGTLPEQIKK